MNADVRRLGGVTRLAVLVTALVLGGTAPTLAQSAESIPHDRANNSG
jgi:hypothetical protein